MSAERIDMHRLQEMVRLHREGVKVREIARLLQMSPNTERAYRLDLSAAGMLMGPKEELPELELLRAAVLRERPLRPAGAQCLSSVSQWMDEVQTMMDRGAQPRSIFDALKLGDDFKGSLSAIKRLCSRLRKAKGIKPEDVTIPVDTDPGEVAQVDFGYVGKLFDPLSGRERKAWVFVMVLGYSRMMFVDIVFDQKVTTWISLHISAFRFFGGVPKVVVPDNLKAAVIRAAFGKKSDVALNRSYRELARYYGFKIDPTPPYAPKKKGKVESGVKYTKNNFFLPRKLKEVQGARADLRKWLEQIANVRVHGTTHQRPVDLFEQEERGQLFELPTKSYQVIEWKQARLHPDCHLEFAGRLYSAPWTLVGQHLWVKATSTTVFILDSQDSRVATHSRTGPKRRSTVEAHLPEHRRDYRHRRRGYWEERAADMGDEVLKYVQAIFDSDDVLYQLRTVQNIVTHLEKFPKARGRRACSRAHAYESFEYKTIKNILRRGLDLQPLPSSSVSPSPLKDPKFARQPSEIIHRNRVLFGSTEGETHEYH